MGRLPYLRITRRALLPASAGGRVDPHGTTCTVVDFAVPPASVAVSVTVAGATTACVDTGTVVLVWPAGTTIALGTMQIDGLLLERLSVLPVDGAGALKVTVTVV